MKFIANPYFCPMNVIEIHNMIEACSKELGFLSYGAAPCKKLLPQGERLELYLNQFFNAGMDYLEKNMDIRIDPELLMEGTKSVMCFLAPYKPEKEQEKNFPQISSYAYGIDYHKAIKDKLYLIVERMRMILPGLKARVFVDSAPILEREWAKEAGLGFIGKNNFLISKEFGLHTFIGVILVDITLKYSEEIVKNGCGNCMSCIKACPTGALAEPFSLDSRKCISYQTIESKESHNKEEFIIDLNDYIFGCDICLKACPWSQKGEATSWSEFKPIFSQNHNKSILFFTKEEWLSIDSKTFLEIFENSPLKRAGISKIHNNLGVK